MRWPASEANSACGRAVLHDYLYSVFPRRARKNRIPTKIKYRISPVIKRRGNMREITYTTAAREGLAEEMVRDPRIFVVVEGIGSRGGNFGTTAGRFAKHGPMWVGD